MYIHIYTHVHAIRRSDNDKNTCDEVVYGRSDNY